MKNINNFNKKGQRHGYQEWYHDNKKISHRGNWRNNKMIGYVEWYGMNETNFHIR
jgi:hypothetical protein